MSTEKMLLKVCVYTTHMVLPSPIHSSTSRLKEKEGEKKEMKTLLQEAANV